MPDEQVNEAPAPAVPETPEVPAETVAEVVQARTSDPSDGSAFVRVFALNVSNLPDDSPIHEANKAEAMAEARRRGLVPTGDVTFTVEQRDYPVATVITYSVPVEPTAAAVANSTSPPQEPAFVPDPAAQ
jgi:hypothetical protein